MNQLTKVFDGHELRIIDKDGEVWFVGKEVAEVLSYKEPHKAVTRHVDEDDGMKYPITDNLGRTQETICINESGLYSLVLKSKMPDAKKFKRWVTSEVLPSIRKHGAYMTNETIEQALLNPDTLIKLATNLKEEQEKRMVAEKQVSELKPKALFADAVETSENSVLVGELSKILRQNGVNIGQNRLFEWLRENGFLIKKEGELYNLPTQRSMDMNLFEVKKRTISNPDGTNRTTRTPKVTGKGQIYFVNKFLSKQEAI